jgi:hypothetical protein
MKSYPFDVVLNGVAEVTDDQADGTPACCNGMVRVHFDRDALSLEEAIRSAITQIQLAGFSISKVEMDAASAVALGA